MKHQLNFSVLVANSIAIALLLSFSVMAQQRDSEVLRTKTELVQTAFTVVNKQGHFVDGLLSEQFQLLVDGQPRAINFFERIASAGDRERDLTGTTNSTVPGAERSKLIPIVPARTIVFFIDDLHLSPDSLNRTRQMLTQFVEREMNSKDRVAITSASGQIGFLEQFSNNRAVLNAAIARLLPRQYDASGYSVGSSTKMTEYMALAIDTTRSDTKVLDFYIEECMKGASGFRKSKATWALIRASCETQVKNSARAVLMQAAQITQNTYNSLESLMHSSARAPGRKLAFFISDGFLLDAGV